MAAAKEVGEQGTFNAILQAPRGEPLNKIFAGG
jgi:hypothetical protein